MSVTTKSETNKFKEIQEFVIFFSKLNVHDGNLINALK